MADSALSRWAPDRSGAPASETKERLLDAAEQLFAERGFEGTSMRAVTQAAGASVSAANYHFGSKEALLHATLLRRVAPLNERRLELLERAESAGAASLEQVLEAFLRPSFERVAEAAARGEPLRFRQVASRLYLDPPDVVANLKQELFGPLTERFRLAFRRALPGADDQVVPLVQQLVVAVMVHVISGQVDVPAFTEEGAESDGRAPEALLRQLISFSAAGARALAGPAAGAGR